MGRREHANTPGQTRKSDSVRKRHRGQQRPLPFDLQILPPIKRRTPVHPECKTEHAQYYGSALKYAGHETHEFLSWHATNKGGRFGLYVQDQLIGRLDDPMDAIAYRTAARMWYKTEVTIVDFGS